jgi:hypothetical protein
VSRIAKRHDTLDPLSGTATDGTGNPIDLTVFTSVKLFATDGGANTFSGECTQKNADGTWTYEQSDLDMSVVGTYDIELECTTAGGDKVHIPNEAAENPTLTIDPDIDDN